MSVCSLQCSASLSVSSGSLTFTAGPSHVAGSFSMAWGQTLALDGSNTTLTVDGSTTADTASFSVSGGAVLTLPGLQSYQKPARQDATWRATGAGSALVFPALTNVVGDLDCCWRLYLQAYEGARVVMSHVISFEGRINVVADGRDSVVDCSGATHLAFGASSAAQFVASNSGKLDFQRVESIGGGACQLTAEGPGSVIDLSRLSAFATPLAPSQLKAINSGTHLLPGSAFLLVNVAVEITGHPVLPAVVSPTASISLYAQPWHSYRVDGLDARVADATWQFFTRVAQTNDLQIIAGPPKSWEMFRVEEFEADPPIVDLRPDTTGLFVPVLFGAKGRSYHLETTAALSPRPVLWSSWSVTTGLMTNTFRVLPSVTPAEPIRFFRALQE